MLTVSNTQMIELLGNKQTLIDNILPTLNLMIPKYSISTNLRISHFLSQILHESAGFTFLKENLNYSAQGLLAVFPKYFTPDLATQYERNPEKIADRVYANRMGNGDEASGEGFKYCGRSFIQITGKENYQSISTDLKVDFVKNPVLLESYNYALEASCWFWTKKNLNVYADKDDIETITKIINGGLNGLSDRQNWLNRCKLIFK